MTKHTSRPVRPGSRIAIVMSNAIGDTLITMVLVQNLRKNGFDVSVFGGPAHALRYWFPSVVVQPLPDPADVVGTLGPYDLVLQLHAHQPVAGLGHFHPNVLIFGPFVLHEGTGCMAERFADLCQRELGLNDVTLDNGVLPPPGLEHRRHRRRIAIHPEASTPDKRWSPQRFIKLARRLQRFGYEVNFLIAPHERERWPSLAQSRIPAPEFGNLHELAAWLYECGWFIGNDSGIGHLASNLHIPTLSLFRRRGVSERWRPGWGRTRVVLPWQWVPTAWLKERLWRQTLTCSRVLSAFNEMVHEHEGSRGRAVRH